MRSELRAIVPAVAVGTVLRCWNLRDQVLVGDEIHAIRVALRDDLLTVLTTYRTADPCLPLAGFYRLVIESGLPLSEMVMRLPVLLAGIASLVVLPLLLGRLAPGAGPVFAWLLALSPTLILYSRIARPYAPIVLWTGMAAGCFWIVWSTWRDGGRADLGGARLPLAGFLVCATLAVWFHLGAAPVIAAIFAFAVLDLAIHRPAGWPGLSRGVLVTALMLAATLALVLLPAAASLQALVASNRVALAVPLDTYGAMLKLQAGSASTIVATLFWVVAILGLVRLHRRRPRAALFTLTLVVGQAVGLRVLSPLGLDHAIAFQRYMLPVLPFVLLWVAIALGPPAPDGSRLAARRFALPLQAAILAGLALSGPFTDRETWRTSFLHDAPYVDFSQPPPRPDAAILAAAARFTEVPGHRPIVEATWPTNRYGGRRFALAQQVHGRRVIVVAPGLAGHRQVAFRSFVGPDPRALLATDAQFLVVRGAPAAPDEWPRRLHRELGPPAWQDGDAQVWDLDAARKRS